MEIFFQLSILKSIVWNFMYVCMIYEHKEITEISFSLLFSFYDYNTARTTCESYFVKLHIYVWLLTCLEKTLQFTFYSRIFCSSFSQSFDAVKMIHQVLMWLEDITTNHNELNYLKKNVKNLYQKILSYVNICKYSTCNVYFYRSMHTYSLPFLSHSF